MCKITEMHICFSHYKKIVINSSYTKYFTLTSQNKMKLSWIHGFVQFQILRHKSINLLLFFFLAHLILFWKVLLLQILFKGIRLGSQYAKIQPDSGKAQSQTKGRTAQWQ